MQIDMNLEITAFLSSASRFWLAMRENVNEERTTKSSLSH